MQCRSCPSTNWTLRNNSDNVSAVLRPKQYTQNSDDDADYRRKFCSKPSAMGGNNCYCHDGNPIRPKLFPTPNSCICLNNCDCHQRAQNNAKKKSSTSITPKIARPCKFQVIPLRTAHGDDDDEDVKHDKRHKIRSRIHFFERYDSARVKEAMRNDATCAVKSIARISAANSQRSSVSGATKKEHSSRSVTINKEPICHESCNANMKTTDESEEELVVPSVPSLKDLREFRTEHFFETHHTTEDLIKDVPEHVCVHRFELDERQLPKAINCDAYGESRCKICQKPMEHVVAATEETETRERRNSFPTFYKYGLAPKKVYMGSGNVRMEVIAEIEDDEQKWERNKKALRNFQYANTCALRFQKGVV